MNVKPNLSPISPPPPPYLGRRGSPMVIGVRSEHELLTEHIPVQYNSGELYSSFSAIFTYTAP